MIGMLAAVVSPAYGRNVTPYVCGSPVRFSVAENTGSGTLSVDRNGEKPCMFDINDDRITYSISIPAETDANLASEIRSLFRVRNATSSPDPDDGGDLTFHGDVEQNFEISYNRSLNYETAPDDEWGDKAYEFGIKGCDPSRACNTMTVIVEIEDVPELSTMLGSVRTTGSVRTGGVIAVDLSNLSDSEGGSENVNVSWRYGTCPSSRGIGEIPSSAGVDVNTHHPIYTPLSYTVHINDVGQPLSIWVQYITQTNARTLKWFCHTLTRSVPITSSLPSISISTSRQSVPQHEIVEFTLTRTSQNLSSSLRVDMYTNQGNVQRRSDPNTGEVFVNRYGRNFHATFPANQRTVTFLIEAVHFETMRVNIKVKYNYNRPSPYTITVPVIAPNEKASGGPVITGTTQEGETLTADVSGITDSDNGDKDEDGTAGDILSSSFSYTWWRTITYGPNDGTSEQIRGASGSTYRIRKADIRHSFFVKVRYRDDRGFNEELQSANTGTVVPAADARPHILDIRLVKHNTGASSFVDLGSDFDIPQGQSFSVYVYMSKNFRHLLNWRDRPGLNLSIGGQTYSLYKYEISKGSNNQNLVEREALKFYFPRDVEVGDSGSIVFPRNGVVINNTPTIDFSYPRTYLGNMTVLGSSQQQASSQQQVVESEPVSQQANSEDEPEDEPEVVTLPPITASFLSMPSEHDGTNSFTFELRFSENLEGFSYKALKNNGAFQVTNGSVANARRLVPGANQHWEITVQPSNNNTIGIILQPTTDCSASGAICHSDGRMLSNGRAGLIQGPVGISVANASANENTDDTIDFTVSLSRASTSTITVNYATQDGTATAGQDYTSKSGMLTFAVGERTKTITVNLINDSIDEGNETFLVNLSNASGGQISDSQAVGTIQNTDDIPKYWLAHMGLKLGSQAVNAVEDRMNGNQAAFHAFLSTRCQKDEPNASKEGACWKEDVATRRDIFNDSENEKNIKVEELFGFGQNFSLYSNKDADADGAGSNWGLWGRFETGRFEGQKEQQKVSGDVKTAFIGADLEQGNWLAGLALSKTQAKGQAHSQLTHDKVDLKAELKSIYPYARYSLNEDTDIWATLGLGRGTLKINDEETDMEMEMGAGGVNRKLWKHDNGAVTSLKGDLLHLKMESEKVSSESGQIEGAEARVKRLRMMTQSEQKIKLEDGAVVTPKLEVAVRYDKGDALNGFGLEAGLGLSYTALDGRLNLEGKGHKLIAKEGKGKDWGLSMAMRLDSKKDGSGLSFMLEPSWGNTDIDVQSLWFSDGTRDLTLGPSETKRLNTELSYGLDPELFGRSVRPYVGFRTGDIIRAGISWLIGGLGGKMSLEFEHTPSVGKDRKDDSALRLQAQTQW